MIDTTDKFIIEAISQAANGILITDFKGHIVWANKAFFQLSGYSPADIIGRTPSILNSGKQSPEFYKLLWESILSGKPWQGEIIERHRDGTFYFVHQVITPICDKDGNIINFIACQHAISAQKKEQQELYYLAHYDSLTKLPNRKLFFDILNCMIEYARQGKRLLAVMFLDMDAFKPVNDRYGHAIGDELLVAVAERLRSAVRKSDTVSRLAGDEFVILLGDLDNIKVVEHLASKLINQIAQPYMIAGNQIEISVSIGITIFPNDADTADELLKAADAAMYLAKSAGKNCMNFFRIKKRIMHCLQTKLQILHSKISNGVNLSSITNSNVNNPIFCS